MKVTCYHISRRKNRDSILERGVLLAGKTEGRIRYAPRIYLSTSIYHLGFDFVGYENVDCWQFLVEAGELKADEFSGNEFHFFIERGIMLLS